VTRRVVLVAGALLTLGAAPPRAVTPAAATRAANRAPRHNTHIAHTRMVVEGTMVVARIRMFRDDLQKALKRTVGDDPASQAALRAYINGAFGVTADGTRLSAEIADSGGDTEGDQPIWWALVQWKATRPVKSVGLKVHLLFDTFSDQQNVVVLNKQPGDERRSLYFQAGDRTEQVIKF
jgi:hypothetical protein